MRPTRVYIAGPYSKGDVVLNVRAAILAAEKLAGAGCVPFTPHLTHFWHLLCPHPVEFWYEQDLEWLRQCDCLLRLPGESAGADNEVLRAEELGLPVYWSIEQIIAPVGAEKSSLQGHDEPETTVAPKILLGTKLRTLRKRSDHTLAAVSGKACVSISLLSDVERGRVNPSLNTLRRLAKFYGVRLGQLLDESDHI